MKLNENQPYASYSLKALARLLNSAPEDSATHRAIREELRRREVAKHDARTALLFTSKEIARLKEFVNLCERLRRLKRNGVLDALADTIIKLAARLSAVHPH